MIMKMTKAVAAGVVFAAFAGGAAVADERKTYPVPEGHPLPEIISGWEFRSPETQALQMDDFDNPGFLLVELAEEQWDVVEGSKGKSCQECHADPAESFAITGATFPKWNADKNKPVNVEEQINICRTEQMGAEPYKLESPIMLGMTALVRSQSRGEPVNVDFSEGDMQSWADRGKELYYSRVGQLDLACSNCHEDNYGNYIRSDLLSQGQTNGFPTYRLKWQGVGSLHRRFKGCMKQVRATPYKPGGEEFTALEVYLAYRGIGLPVEAPAVRN